MKEVNKRISGAIAVGGDATIGGKSVFRDNVHACENMRVSGWLDAPHIIGICKGLFGSFEELEEMYPHPHDGWCAFVGDIESESDVNRVKADVYYVRRHRWVNMGDSKVHFKLNAPLYERRFEELRKKDREQDGLLARLKERLITVERKLSGYDWGDVNSGECGCGLSDDEIAFIRKLYLSEGTGSGGNHEGTETGKYTCKFLSSNNGTSPTATEITEAAKGYVGTSLNGVMTVDITPNRYFWVCLPMEMVVPTIRSSGFAVPLEAAVIVSTNLGNYRCIRFSGKPQTTPLQLEFSTTTQL